MKTVLALAALVLISVPAHAFPARIARCHDGDTCTTDAGLRVRLAEIDAPEIDQPYGIEAQRVICAIVCGRFVDVEPRGRSYDRLVGLIRVQGVDTSEAMVRAGAAWDYSRYDYDRAMPGLEAEARRAGRGLWADPRAIPPWEWRRGLR